MDKPELIFWRQDMQSPLMPNPPNWNDVDAVVAEVAQLEGSANKDVLRSGMLISGIYRRGLFLSADHKQPTLSNLSRWFMVQRNVDLSISDLRLRILPFETFGPFGQDVLDWIDQFYLSTRYAVALNTRKVLDADPLQMSPFELKQARPTIDQVMFLCGAGTPHSKVDERFIEGGLLKKEDLEPKSRKKTLPPSVFATLATSTHALIKADGQKMFLPRQIPQRGTIEDIWATWFESLCDANSLGRDECFRRLMTFLMKKFPTGSTLPAA